MAWTDSVVTNAGLALLRQAQAPPEFIAAAGGAGTVPAAALMAQTALADKRQDISIAGIVDVEQGMRLQLRVTNIALEAGYTLSQVGIWATAGALQASPPILFAMLQETAGMPIPSNADAPEFVFDFYVIIPISNAAKWSAKIDPSALATLGDMETLKTAIVNVLTSDISNVEADAKAHAGRSDNPHGVTAAQAGAWPTDVMPGVNWKHPLNPAHYIYVAPAPTGSDSDGDGTAGKPYATLGKAVEAGNLYTRDSYVRIDLAGGDYYEPVLCIYGAGAMHISGPGSGERARLMPTGTECLIIEGCSALTITDVDMACYSAIPQYGAFIKIRNSMVMFSGSKILSAVSQPNTLAYGVIAYSSNVVIDGSASELSGFPVCACANKGSVLRVQTRGQAVHTAYWAIGGVIIVHASVPPIFGAASEDVGGRIHFSHLQGAKNDIVIYLNPDGDDRNWGQNAAYPVKTLARARDIAQRCEGTGKIIIRFEGGPFEYQSTIIFIGISRDLVLNSLTSAEIIQNFASGIGCQFASCVSVVLENLKFRKTMQNNSAAIHCIRSSMAASNIEVTADQKQTAGSGIAVDTGVMRIINSKIKNMQACIIASNAGYVNAYNNKGTDNNIGYQSNGGVLLRTSEMPGAVTPYLKTNGGQISDNGVWV